MRRNIVGIGVAAAGLVLAAACGSNATTSSSTTTAPTTAGGSSGGATSGTRVTATLTEFHISLSMSSFKPGTYTFVAVNSGAVPHSLEINGPGVSDQRVSGDISPGQSGSITVTLRDGMYDVFCPVDGHKAIGMDVMVMVSGTGGGVSTGGGSSTSTTKSGGYGGY
jgi:uncharacterized cupredoxin-like copper-binding protein